MPHTDDYTPIWNAVEQVIENGLEGLESAGTIWLNEAMRIERTRALKAEPWHRISRC
jgi:hypothetical protein